MSNYTKSTNFATKDNLSPGNPLKIVKGTEIDTEFNNIATAVATKTDNASAAITGGSITGITDLAVADGGTGASTATAALNNLLPTQTSNANKYLQTDGTNATWDAVSLSTADITGTLPVANGGTGVTSSTGTGNVVLSNSPTLVTPALGTPASGTATNLTGLPISTGVSGLGTGVATFLATPSSANLISAVTDETGSGALVFANSPTLVTPALGTPSALVGTNITGTASGLTAGNVTTNANLTGAITSTGNATSLGSFSSANLLGALTDETGTGSAVFATSPTLVTPILGTPTSGTATNLTGLPLTTGVTGLLPVANGGTATATPSIVAGTNVTVTGTWPNQTIAASGGSGTVTSVAATVPSLFSISGSPITTSGTLAMTYSGTALPVVNGGTGQTTYTDGQLLIGNTTGNTLTKATLTAGSGVTITNGSGAITIAASGATPAGSNTQVQFNNSGAFGASANLNFDGTNLGLGVTPSAWNSIYDVIQFGPTGAVFSSSSNESLLGNNVFYNSLNTGKYLVTDAASLYYQAAGTHTWFTAPSGTAGNTVPFTQVLAIEGSKSLALQGATSQTGTGITFPATQSASTDANTLDDYEEGTWTAVLSASGGTFTVNDRDTRYTKIGRAVSVSGYVQINCSSGSGANAVSLTGFPFSTSTGGSFYQSVCIGFANFIGNGNGFPMIGSFDGPSSTTVLLRRYQSDAGTTKITNLNSQDITNGNFSFMLNGTYFV